MDRMIIPEISLFFLVQRIGKGISYFIFFIFILFYFFLPFGITFLELSLLVSKVMVRGSGEMVSLIKSYDK